MGEFDEASGEELQLSGLHGPEARDAPQGEAYESDGEVSDGGEAAPESEEEMECPPGLWTPSGLQDTNEGPIDAGAKDDPMEGAGSHQWVRPPLVCEEHEEIVRQHRAGTGRGLATVRDDADVEATDPGAPCGSRPSQSAGARAEAAAAAPRASAAERAEAAEDSGGKGVGGGGRRAPGGEGKARA